MTQSHNLGFPRIGEKRELKRSIEKYWKGLIGLAELRELAKDIRQNNFKKQAALGINIIPTGDFSYYDQTLDMSLLLGLIPPRFRALLEKSTPEDAVFTLARGASGVAACEMTKWFNTNYHYIVPEFDDVENFKLSGSKIFDETKEALALGLDAKPVLLGPLSYLHLGKYYLGENSHARKLTLLPSLLKAYVSILEKLDSMGLTWIQIDEPIFALDLEQVQKTAFVKTYVQLKAALKKSKLLVATYFNKLGDNKDTFLSLAADGLHLDASDPHSFSEVIALSRELPKEKTLSVGIVNGRNIWINDLSASQSLLQEVKENHGENLLIAPSCSLLHAPITLRHEAALEANLKSVMAFAEEKLSEVVLLSSALNGQDISSEKQANAAILEARAKDPSLHLSAVQDRLAALREKDFKRNSSFTTRRALQQKKMKLPLFPSTTVGSFPQTKEIRIARAKFRRKELSQQDYQNFLKKEIAHVIGKQEEVGLDVLVHGESERNDMVEYFADKLHGYRFTKNGWVQSYGTRCVKPPIIYGDVQRKFPMTVSWAEYAQSLTKKPVKGMLTAAVTMLQWSFVREDQTNKQTAFQIALALQDEVLDLEKSGIAVIQLDEPAIREGLPLRKSEWHDYLDWAVKSFLLSSSQVKDETQIQTHMCYSYFNDILDSIIALDADVILIESSRSKMKLLQPLGQINYPADIGPGVYDIHSPRVPSKEEIKQLLKKAIATIDKHKLWITPDCGLKTRSWDEAFSSLKNLQLAANELREEYA